MYDSILAALPEERREKNRYPIKLDLTWSIMFKGNRVCGSGRTSNMSSSGVLFKHSEIPPEVVGRDIAMRIEWPALLEGRIPMLLMAHGKIVRLDSMGCAVQLQHTQFKTCKARADANVFEASA